MPPTSAPTTPFVALDDAQVGLVRLFRDPVRILRADTPAAVPLTLAAMRAALSAGHHLAGYASYELGLVLEPRLAPRAPTSPAVPFLWFGVFASPPDILQGEVLDRFWGDDGCHAGPLRTEWDHTTYEARFDTTRALIEAGDIFQANLTFRARFTLTGDPRALFRDLRAHGHARYGALLHDGERDILSISPELFFRTDADGTIRAAPMKGTAPRGDDPATDARRRDDLARSPKDRAENLMIVDLLRNDIGRLAALGTVTVDELFAVETYPTLHTMVSHLSARLAVRKDPESLFRALFPCGSITGAPKIRAMEVIDALEASPRGLYCGAIGHFAPDGASEFNVAIRTITIDAAGHAELGIGGAVTADSQAGDEWSEALLKARTLERARQPLHLIETLRHEASVFIREHRHLARMQSSASVFAIPFDQMRARQALQSAVRHDPDRPLRVRLSLHEDGRFSAAATPLDLAPERWRCTISPLRLSSTDLFLRHKTSRRALYDREAARVARTGHDEVLFLNERGEVCEGARSTIFVERDGVLLTPPIAAGLLPGCLRAELLDTGRAQEAALTRADLSGPLWLGNSLRGLTPATLTHDAPA